MNLIEALVVTLACAAVSRFYLHMFQLESYQLDGYLRWMNGNRERLFGATLAVGLVATVASLLLPLFFMMFARRSGQMIGDIVALVGFAAAALYTFQAQYIVAQNRSYPFVCPAAQRTGHSCVSFVHCRSIPSAGFGIFDAASGTPHTREICQSGKSPPGAD